MSWLVKYFMAFSFAGILLLNPAGLFADEGKKADKEVKKCTAEIKCATPCAEKQKAEENHVNIEVKTVVPPVKKPADSTHNETGDIKIYNYGIQATFINSSVTVSGGTITNELTKTAPGAAAPSKPGQAPPGKPGQPPSKPPQKEKPSKFDETIKDATKQVGLFIVHTKKDKKILWEVDPKQLDKNFLIKAVMATGVGSGMAKPGSLMDGTEDPMSLNSATIVKFRKIDKKIQLYQPNLRFIDSDHSPETKGIAKNYGDSLVASFPIAATNPKTGAFLIDTNKFFMTDFFQVGRYVSRSLGGGYGLDGQNSYVKESKVNPENVLTRMSYALRSGTVTGNIAVPDSRSVNVELLVNIMPLRDNPDFKSRVADNRVGHWIEAHYDFGKDKRRSAVTRHITRWDIRKASPELDMSPPVKPLVFWIENTVPKPYRKGIRDGVLLWNKAFRAIGIEDAIVVKEQPDDADWDISDIRYNTIHWNVSHGRAYGAIAQWVADPRTGEILNGSFLMEAENIRGLYNMQRIYEPGESLEMLRQRLQDKPEGNKSYPVCDYGNFLRDQTQFGLTVLAARQGIENVTGEMLDEIVYQHLVEIACHEMGHVLSLRHNFEASTLHKLEDLHDKALVAEKGLTASVMEYTPFNIAPEGIEQGYYFTPTIGPYDCLAIEYAYKEFQPKKGQTEADLLNEIAEKAETRDYPYGTDSDRGTIDPLVNTFDLGRDPLNYAKQMTQISLDTIPKLLNLAKEGDDYRLVRSALINMIYHYYDSTVFAGGFIGGQYVTRVKKGGSSNVEPLEPVSAAKQREALNFYIETLFSDEIFNIDPELLKKLASQKWLHWGARYGGASEFRLNNYALNLYDMCIYSLFSPIKINRIMELDRLQHPEEMRFTVPELFKTVSAGVWSELDSPPSDDDYFSNKKPLISTYRRMLQRIHLKRMISIMLESSPMMPEDGRTQAWRTLTVLEERLSKVMDQLESNGNIDDYSRDHLAESLAKIQRSLEAKVSARVDFW